MAATVDSVMIEQFCARLHDTIMDKYGVSVPITWDIHGTEIIVDVAGDFYYINPIALTWVRVFFV